MTYNEFWNRVEKGKTLFKKLYCILRAYNLRWSRNDSPLRIKMKNNYQIIITPSKISVPSPFYSHCTNLKKYHRDFLYMHHLESDLVHCMFGNDRSYSTRNFCAISIPNDHDWESDSHASFYASLITFFGRFDINDDINYDTFLKKLDNIIISEF